MSATTTRRWDRAELAALVDFHLAAAVALEQWLKGDGLGSLDPSTPTASRPTSEQPTSQAPPPVLSLRRQDDLSASELARILGVSNSTVSQWCRQGTLANCYMVPATRSPNGMWMIPIAEAREAASFASALRTSRPRLTDRSVSIATAKHLRAVKGMPPLGRKGRADFRKARLQAVAR